VKNDRLRKWTALSGISLLALNILVRCLPFEYDTPSRHIVASEIAVAGFALLLWSPFGIVVLVRFWKRLHAGYRLVIAANLAIAAALVYSAF
jgi:hypothetical protein